MNQVQYAPSPSFVVAPQKKITRKRDNIFYPDSDGNPMADNTLQFYWIMMIEGNLEILFKNRPDVFVAGDLLWYPVERHPEIRQAPDVLVAFGRPKGYRGSYRQWEEDNLPLQVVFEILSPGNRAGEMRHKFDFYNQYGVEEYYIYDPDRKKLQGWLRRGGQLSALEKMNGWISPRLDIRFELVEDELQLYHPTGERFISHVESVEQRERDNAVAEAQLILAEARIEQEWQRAEQEQQARNLAEQRAEQERQARNLAEQRAISLETELARLRAELARNQGSY